MAKLKIVWTETATIVFQQILTFYNVRNGNTQYSRSIYTMVRDVLQLVAKYPYMYKATSVPNIRVFHCDYFKVYYRVLEKQILVEAVFPFFRFIPEEELPLGEFFPLGFGTEYRF